MSKGAGERTLPGARGPEHVHVNIPAWLSSLSGGSAAKSDTLFVLLRHFPLSE